MSENRGFSFIYEYLSPFEQHLGASKEKRKEMVTSLLMNRTMYKLVFAAYSSQFDKSMPIMEDVMILWSIQSGHQNQNQYGKLERCGNKSISQMGLKNPIETSKQDQKTRQKQTRATEAEVVFRMERCSSQESLTREAALPKHSA